MIRDVKKLLLPQLMFTVAPGFDPGAFGNASFEGEGDTRRFQHEAKEYSAIVMGPWGEKSKIATTDKGQVQLVLQWQPDDPAQAQKYQLEKLPVLFHRIFLDLTPQGGLDMGPFKNAELNKLRAAFGMNKNGLPWKFADFVGKAAKITVTHRPNPENAQEPYVNVTAVTAL